MSKVFGKLKPLNDNVIVSDMNFEERKTAGGIVLLGDDGKTEGIRHRWGKVYAIGPAQTDVKIGDWILVEHGRWTRGVTIVEDDGTERIIRRVDVNAILMVTDEDPGDNTFGSHTKAQGQVFSPDMFAR
jgi:co-chaperonin GroES (HSP10)